MSFHYLAYIITSCSFSVEPTRSDYGYDLSVFTFDDAGAYENGSFFVQLKATDRIRTDPLTGHVRFRIAKRDLLMWEDETFPVYLVVFDALRAKAYSLYLQKYLQENAITAATMIGKSLEVSLPNLMIDMPTVRSWRDDKNAILTKIGALRHA